MLSPSPSLGFMLLSPSPLSALLHQCFHCAGFCFFTFDFYVLTQLPPMTFLPLICSVTPAHSYPSTYISNGLIASPLLVLTFPVTHCLLLFPPASSLIISFLYPPLPVVTYTSPFLFSFSSSSVSSPTRSPVAPQTRTRWQGPHVHLHLCSKLH